MNNQKQSEWLNEPVPTHRCKECGALWRFWRKEETPSSADDSWNLRSGQCGKCCDTKPMGDQIEPLTLGEITKYIVARHAVDSMTLHFLGPQNGDKVN